jgi:hypothetical protein
MMRRVGRFLRQSKGLGQWSNFIARAMQQLWRNRIPADATESGQAVGKKQQKLLGTEKPPIQGPPFPLPPGSDHYRCSGREINCACKQTQNPKNQ